jgi:hypothetical protein
MIPQYKFGDYDLSEPNNLHVDSIREFSGAERDLVILKMVGVRGAKVLDATDQGKVIEVTLGIECLPDRITQIRELVRALGRKNQPLQIQNDSGLFVYDGCYLMNMDDIVERVTQYNKRILKAKMVFFSPKGFVREFGQTVISLGTIENALHEVTVNIDGTTEPEPVILFQFDDPSTADQVRFVNLTTGQGITISLPDLSAGEVVAIDTDNKVVTRGTGVIDFLGIFPEFRIGANNLQITLTGADNISEEQTSSDGEIAVFGNNWIAQKIEADGTGERVAAALQLKKFETPQLELFDNFSAGSVDGNKWTVNGSVGITSGKLRIGVLSGNNSSNATALGKTFNALGWRWTFQVVNRGTAGQPECFSELRNSDGTKRITVRHSNQVNAMFIQTTGYGGAASGQFATSGAPLVDIFQSGANIQVWVGGTLRLTISNQALASSTVHGLSNNGTNQQIRLDDVEQYVLGDSNTNLTLEIQTDNSGVPSGTPVTNGTLTFPVSEISSDLFTEILREFATAPSLTNGTVYHLVIYQTGGDTNNYILVRKNSAGGYADGHLLTSTNGGSTWTAVTAEDLFFKLVSSVPTGLDIPAELRYFKSHYLAG